MSFTLPSGRVEDLDTPDAHVTLIRSQWRDFAAFAWEKYSSGGRGAIVIDLRNATRTAASLHVPTFWVSNGSERLSARGGWPSDEIAEIINDYDPELDVVFLVLRLDGDVFHYNVSDELTPPQAFERRSAAAK